MNVVCVGVIINFNSKELEFEILEGKKVSDRPNYHNKFFSDYIYCDM